MKEGVRFVFQAILGVVAIGFIVGAGIMMFERLFRLFPNGTFMALSPVWLIGGAIWAGAASARNKREGREGSANPWIIYLIILIAFIELAVFEPYIHRPRKAFADEVEEYVEPEDPELPSRRW